MKKTMSSKAIIIATKKGYEVDSNGNVFYKNKKYTLRLHKGYYYFSIRMNIKNKSRMIPIATHRYIGYKKFGNKIFKKGMQVRHLDSNSLNNKIDNIGIGTASDNHMDKDAKVRLNASLIGTSFIKIHHHGQIINLHKQGLSYSEIMKTLNISSKGTISYIVKKSVIAKHKK